MLITHEFIFKNWITESRIDQETYEYINMFMVSGSIHVIKNWVENGMDKTPEEMAAILNRFINRGLSGVR